MRYIRAGEGEVVVLVHGFLSGCDYWEEQIESLRKSFEVIAIELPGFGESAKQPSLEKIADFADVVLEKLDTLGVKSFHLVGHSMGGMITQEIAIKVPDRVRRLVLYGTGPIGNLPGRFEPLEVSIERARQADDIAQAIRSTVQSWFNEGSKAAGFESGLELAKNVSNQSYINGLHAMLNWNAMARLDQIQSKTLVIWGDKDRSYIWRQPYTLWQEIKDTNLAVMPGCSHNAHLENSQLFNLILLKFLMQD